MKSVGIVAVVILAFFVFIGYMSMFGPNAPQRATPTPIQKVHLVTLRAVSFYPVLITVSTPDGIKTERYPTGKAYDYVVKRGAPVSISVVGASADNPSVRCEIYLDGKLAKQMDASGQYAGVMCNGVVP